MAVSPSAAGLAGYRRGWRAEDDETENYVYAVALLNDG
jgi:hypothetical protein